MSFSLNVKDELCRLPLGKTCCMLSELTALYRTNGSLSFHGMGRVQVQYRTENPTVARRIFRLLRTRMNITPRLHYVQHARLQPPSAFHRLHILCSNTLLQRSLA